MGTEYVDLINRLIESPEGIKTVVNGVIAAAPRLVLLRGTPFDLSGTIGQALMDFIDFKISGLKKLPDYLRQRHLFDSERPEKVKLLLGLFDAAPGSALIREKLQHYGESAEKADFDNQTPSLIVQPTTAVELLKCIFSKVN